MPGKTYGDPGSFFRDYCPLCGSRFFGDSPEEVCQLITSHIDDGTCENNFKTLEGALSDEGEDYLEE